MFKSNRGTIFLEDAVVLQQTPVEGNQRVCRFEAPKCATHARAGAFIHITCDALIPMRRPLSIMRVDAEKGWVEFLYRVHGPGLTALASRKAGEKVSLLGPIGNGFTVHPERPRPLMIAAGYGIPTMVFLADRLRERADVAWKPLVLLGSESPFPFRVRPSQIVMAEMPEGAIACMPLMDEWGIASRLATKAGFPGCFDGGVTQLADEWLSAVSPGVLGEIEFFACGPTSMLKDAAGMARKHGVPCQVSMEEHMACAVGACAGCTVTVRTQDGPAMKRVCVDGPIFDGYTVFAS